jgi:ribonuclease BN (tRNA processing enzyme)
VELTVLGSSAAYPAAGGAASGYLLRHDGFNLWIDAGTGTLSNIQKFIAHYEVDAVLVSHEHPDHCVDLYPLYVARTFHPDPLPKLPIFGLPGVFGRVMGLEGADDGGAIRDVFDMRTVEPGSAFEIGPYRVETRLLPHWVPNIGMRLSTDGLVLAYTGDTGPDEGVEAIGRDADLLITEASWQDGHEAPQRFHLTSREAGQHAQRAGSRRLLLSHFWPGTDREVSLTQAKEAYGEGEIVLASEGLSVEIDG